ncbi:MAG: ATP-binding protein, partial [Candidatus Dormibacteria bacterium]
ADAMAGAAATVRNTLPLQIRTRLAHALLQEAVRRFKERSQAPMLKSASGYFAQITGNEFEGLINDDSNESPVIAAKRPGGAILSVEAMSDGTRDQLYLALRLAALKLQRERGVDLPVILDDVLMASDDVRAGCIFKALADFSASGQVIVFTHHDHLCDVARRNVDHDAIAVVELKRA